MPIFLSKGLLDQLFVFQYPLKSVATSAERTSVAAVRLAAEHFFLNGNRFGLLIELFFHPQSRIKPKLQEVELEVEIPTRTPHYDRGEVTKHKYLFSFKS